MIQLPSPNFEKGRKNNTVIGVVIHIMDGSLSGTDSWFSTSVSQVSTHYGIGVGGEIHQYVNEIDTAWGNGIVNNPSWKLIKKGVNPNLYTISIEHEGRPDSVWTDAMKKQSALLITDICKRWNIPIDREHIIGHYEIDLLRKPNCPAYNKGIINELVTLANLYAKKKTLMEKLVELLKKLLALKK